MRIRAWRVEARRARPDSRVDDGNVGGFGIGERQRPVESACLEALQPIEMKNRKRGPSVLQCCLHRPPCLGIGRVIVQDDDFVSARNPARPAHRGSRSPFAAARYRLAHGWRRAGWSREWRQRQCAGPRARARPPVRCLGRDDGAGAVVPEAHGDDGDECWWDRYIHSAVGVDQCQRPVDTSAINPPIDQITGLAHLGHAAQDQEPQRQAQHRREQGITAPIPGMARLCPARGGVDPVAGAVDPGPHAAGAPARLSGDGRLVALVTTGLLVLIDATTLEYIDPTDIVAMIAMSPLVLLACAIILTEGIETGGAACGGWNGALSRRHSRDAAARLHPCAEL